MRVAVGALFTGGLLATWALLSATGRPASACSGGAGGIFSRETWPADGATGLPLNTAFVLTYNVSSLVVSPTGLQLRPQGGAPVALEPVSPIGGNTFVVRPQAPLLPQTVYEVLDTYTVPCQATECNGGSPHVVASFTTGDAADLTPPTFGGLAGIATTRATVPVLGCISATDYYTFTLSWAAAADPGGADVRYHVYAGSERLASFLSATSIQGSMACLVATATWLPSSSWSKPLTVRAVDLAGNEDQNQIAMSVNLPCPRPNDTGVGGRGGSQPDAGTIPDAAAGGAGGAAGGAGAGGSAGAAGGAGGGTSPIPGDTPDASAPEMDAPAVDAAVPGSDVGAGGAGGSGTLTPPMTSGGSGNGGCSCDASGTEAGFTAVALTVAVLAIAGTTGKRRRGNRSR